MERTHNQSALLNFLTCLLIAAGALSLGCHEDDKTPLVPPDESPARNEYPPTARPDTVAHFRADLAAVRHPSDGGGSVELVLADGDTGYGNALNMRRTVQELFELQMVRTR